MQRVWAWFYEPSAVLSLVEELDDKIGVSILLRDPDSLGDVVVTGPMTEAMGCYPFLDVRHQIRRFGVRKAEAEHYVRVLARGGAVVCLEAPGDEALRTLTELDAHDVLV